MLFVCDLVIGFVADPKSVILTCYLRNISLESYTVVLLGQTATPLK